MAEQSQFRIEEFALFQLMSVNSNWIGHTPQEAEFKLTEVKFTEL